MDVAGMRLRQDNQPIVRPGMRYLLLTIFRTCARSGCDDHMRLGGRDTCNGSRFGDR